MKTTKKPTKREIVKGHANGKAEATALKPSPKGKRPRCLDCTSELEPQFTQPVMPAKLNDGRRHAQREAWEKSNPQLFTGHYGRLRDDRFCGTSCGYNWAVKHTKAQK